MGRRRRSQAWRSAWAGVIRVFGSQSRQRLRKSMKSGSSQPFKAVGKSFEPGMPRGLPRRDRPPWRALLPSGIVTTVQYLG